MTVRSAVATRAGLPGLAAAAPRAADPRGDGRLEGVAAATGVQRAVLGAAGAAGRRGVVTGVALGAGRGGRGSPGAGGGLEDGSHLLHRRPEVAKVALVRSEEGRADD